MSDPSLLEHVPERAKDFAAVGGIGTWLYLAAKTMLRNDKRQGETDRRRDDADKLTGETYQQTIELLKGEVTRLGEEVQRLVSDVRNYRDQCFDCKLWQEARKLRDGESTDQPSEEPHV